MAYYEIFYAEFKEMPNVDLGLTPAQYRISFRAENFSGFPSALEVYAKSPCRISKTDSSNNRFLSLHALKATISLRAASLEQAYVFYLNSDRAMQVVVQRDAAGGIQYLDTVFCGWALPTDFSIDYKKPPFALELTAACGLASLKDRPMLSPDGKRFKGFLSVSTALRYALALTGFDLPLITGNNLYEAQDIAVGQTLNGMASPSRDPLFNTLIHAEQFISDAGEPLSAYDVLVNLLDPFKLRLAQANGAWMAVEADQVAGGWDVTNLTGTSIRTRTYEAIAGTTGPVSNESVDLVVNTSPFGALRIKNEPKPKIGLLVSRPGIRIEQNFGARLSIIPNGDFAQIDQTGLPTGFRTNNLSPQNRFRVGTGTNADPYAIRIYDCGDEKINNDTPYVAVEIQFNPASKQYTQFQKRTLTFDAHLNNLHAAKAYVTELRDDGLYIHTQNGFYALSKIKNKDMVATLFVNTYVDQDGHEKAKPGKFKCTLDLGELDHVLKLTIFLCMGECLPFPDANNRPYIEYSNLQLVSEQKGLVLNGTQTTIANPGKLVKDATLTIQLGDGVSNDTSYDRVGSTFYRHASGIPVLTDRWFRPNANILAVNPTGKDVGKPRLQWVAEAYARQFLFRQVTAEGILTGRLPHGVHNVIHVFDLSEAAYLQLTRWEWDLRLSQHTLTAVSIAPDNQALPTAKKQWQTPDGLLDISPGADGASLEPTPPTLVSERQKLKNALVDLNLVFPTGKPFPSLPVGFVQVPAGTIQFGLELYNNGQKVGSRLSVAEKLIRLKFPQ